MQIQYVQYCNEWMYFLTCCCRALQCLLSWALCMIVNLPVNWHHTNPPPPTNPTRPPGNNISPLERTLYPPPPPRNLSVSFFFFKFRPTASFLFCYLSSHFLLFPPFSYLFLLHSHLFIFTLVPPLDFRLYWSLTLSLFWMFFLLPPCHLPPTPIVSFNFFLPLLLFYSFLPFPPFIFIFHYSILFLHFLPTFF